MGRAYGGGVPDAAPTFEERLAALEAQIVTLTAERDEYKRAYLEALEKCRKLELGILGQQREKLPASDAQLTIEVLGMLLGRKDVPDPETPVPTSASAAAKAESRAAAEKKPTGRRSPPEHLPRVKIEIVPPEVQKKGLDAFLRIGEDICETIERRPSSLVVVKTIRGKYVPKDRDRLGETEVLQAAPPDLPIERGLAGPGLIADTIVRRWDDHQPLHRMERIYCREGLELSRSTICGWHAAVAALAAPLIAAMWKDAKTAPYLCTDATGVLVLEKEKCQHAHFWVVAVPDRHVLFAYSRKHDSAAVDKVLGDYRGTLVLDAHTVYDHLFKQPGVLEQVCWAHARRYWFKALESDPERARKGLALIGELFRIERGLVGKAPDQRLAARQEEAKPVVKAYFAWCEGEADRVLDETASSRAVNYSLNQRKGLERFLTDGRIPIHNNFSERELRREALGRKNWLFVGSDDGGDVNATFVSLLASCHLHGIEPFGYLRDLLCLLPGWPQARLVELAPVNWEKTLQQEDAQRRLAANVFRQASLGLLDAHRDEK